MKILIVEDEEHAVRQLRLLLDESTERADVVGVLDSVEDAVRFLSDDPPLDLILLDIHLADGSAFEIFQRVHVDTPIIFTTAYDAYAIKAFDVNSIDYLLKPVRKEALMKALDKLDRVEFRRRTLDSRTIERIAALVEGAPGYKRSFLLPYHDRLVPVLTDDFAHFSIKNDVVRGVTFDNRHFVMEETLQELADQLDPSVFFRANRQVLFNYQAIVDVQYFFNGRLQINLKPPADEKVLVSKARATEFKDWMQNR